MKKAIEAIFISIFTVCLSINYVFANPFLKIEEFVNSGSPNKIQQVQNSKWCVPTCTDIAAAYISRASRAELTDVSVQHNILVNGAVHENITDNGLNLDEQFEAIQIGARIIPFISSAPMARIRNLVSTEEYELHNRVQEFLKNILYKRPVGQRHNWKCNNNICVIIGEYLHKELTAFTDKDTEEEVDETLNQFVSSLQESDLQQLYSLNKAILCLHRNLPFIKELIEEKLHKWFQSECEIKPVIRQADDISNSAESNKTTRETCFNNIVASIDQGRVIILDCVYDTNAGRGNHACIVVGVTPPGTGERYLEVYNPDPSYSGMNPMQMDKQLTYIAPDGKTKVVSRYTIITPITPETSEEAPKEENK